MAEELKWLRIEKAAEQANCSPQYLRRVLLAQELDSEDRTVGGPLLGWRVNGKAWMVEQASLAEFAKGFSSRAGKHRTAKKKRAAKARRKA